VSRLALEAAIKKKAAGPHVASFLGLLRLEGELVLVTYCLKYCILIAISTLYSNKSLKDIIENKKRATVIPKYFQTWFKQLYSAVRWLHRLGIIHCDIKPSVRLIFVIYLICARTAICQAHTICILVISGLAI
jgi:serine/threonine protein kinase